MEKWDIVVHYGLFFCRIGNVCIDQHCAVVNLSTLKVRNDASFLLSTLVEVGLLYLGSSKTISIFF